MPLCGNCVIMPSAAECVCCKEIENIQSRMEAHGSHVDCVTSHPGFHPACLNVYVLQIAHSQCRQQYKTIQDSAE